LREISAGIGNQLFMYSTSYALAKRLNAELWLNIYDRDSAFNTVDPFDQRNFNEIKRNFALDFFDIRYSRIVSTGYTMKLREKALLISKWNLEDIDLSY